MSSVRWPEVTAIFGGAFDPPHLGHLEAVRGLFARPGVGHVRVIPAALPPHKPGIASAEARLAMARAQFENLADVTVDDRELARARRNPGVPSYSFDTLQELRREFPNLAFVLGADQLAAMADPPGWHRFPEILGLCHWVVLARRPDGEARARKTLTEWEGAGLARPARGPIDPRVLATWELLGGTQLVLAPTEAHELSSTFIREAIARHGQPPVAAISPAILAYLKGQSIYGIEKTHE